MVNIYDSANQLAEDLTKTPEFAGLKEAIAAVKADENSSELFNKMDEIQGKIMAAQQSGQPLSEDLQKDENIVKLLTAEQGLYKTIDDVQKAFTKPINDLYEEIRK